MIRFIWITADVYEDKSTDCKVYEFLNNITVTY